VGTPESQDVRENAARDVDDAAVARIFNRYAEQLARLAELHLSRKTAGRLDGEDVVQSVFRTFFRRCSAGEFKIDGSAEVWQLLVRITLLKARAKGRFHTADRRNVQAEAPAGDAPLREVASSEPGPAEVVAVIDQIDSLVRDLPPFYTDLLESRLRGCSASETAQELRVSRRTVHRALSLLRHRLIKAAKDGQQ
jgi:RNA polymerase sigma-70 factor (ECF subfamily)